VNRSRLRRPRNFRSSAAPPDGLAVTAAADVTVRHSPNVPRMFAQYSQLIRQTFDSLSVRARFLCESRSKSRLVPAEHELCGLKLIQLSSSPSNPNSGRARWEEHGGKQRGARAVGVRALGICVQTDAPPHPALDWIGFDRFDCQRTSRQRASAKDQARGVSLSWRLPATGEHLFKVTAITAQCTFRWPAFSAHGPPGLPPAALSGAAGNSIHIFMFISSGSAEKISIDSSPG